MLELFVFFAKKGFWFLINPHAYFQLFFIALLYLGVDLRKWQRVTALTLIFCLSHLAANIFRTYNIITFNPQHIQIASIISLLILALYTIFDQKSKKNTFENLLVFTLSFVINLSHQVYSFHQHKLLAIAFYNVGVLAAIVLIGMVLILLLNLISKIANTPINKSQKVINAVAFLNILYVLYDFYY